MSYPINYPTPQGANVQVFNCNSPLQQGFATWVKPQGANMVWITLIGAGGGGGGSNGSNPYGGGGSGAVTNLMIPAFLVPDNLIIDVGAGGGPTPPTNTIGAGGQRTAIYTYLKNDYLTSDLLVASAGGGGDLLSGGSGGSASSANFFTAAGFFQSVAGATGAFSTFAASSTTFLSGGAGSGQQSQGNYGYTNNPTNPNSANGFFQMSPIIVGVGATGANTGGATPYAQNAGIGCGGAGSADGVTYGGAGGNGLAVIITW